MKIDNKQALRYNEGKNEIGLVPTELIEGVAKVMTYGKNKYTIRDDEGKIISSGAENWRKGLSWSSVINSLDRHWLEFKKGTDVDPESFLLHLEHVGANLGFLLNYYKSHPELDDRYKAPQIRVGLDIDDVCLSFVPAYCKKYNLQVPNSWYLDYDFIPRIEELAKDEDFWMNLEPLFDPNALKFEPIVYITARDERLKEYTSKWLEKHNFPKAPVVFSRNKGEVCKEYKLTHFIDDSPKNFREVNESGTACFLLDTPWNKYIDVGYRRIKNVNDII